MYSNEGHIVSKQITLSAETNNRIYFSFGELT